jgi:hypothetical protein
MVIYELPTGSFPDFKNNKPLPPEKVRGMKVKEGRTQTPELLSSDPYHPFFIVHQFISVM